MQKIYTCAHAAELEKSARQKYAIPDFLMMENEFLEEDNVELQAQIEIDRADIDYCLMLLEDE